MPLWRSNLRHRPAWAARPEVLAFDSCSDTALAQAAAQRRARTALARRLQAEPLSWQQLMQCPLWVASPAPALDTLSTLVGIYWLKASLKACINGRQLAPLSLRVGAGAFRAALEAPDTPELLARAPRPLLPPAHTIVSYVGAWGQALLLWDCVRGLQECLARQLGWSSSLDLLPTVGSHSAWAQSALQQAHAAAPALAAQASMAPLTAAATPTPAPLP